MYGSGGAVRAHRHVVGRAVLAGTASEAVPWAKAEDSPPRFRPYARPLRRQAGQGAGQSGPPLPPHYSGSAPRIQGY